MISGNLSKFLPLIFEVTAKLANFLEMDRKFNLSDDTFDGTENLKLFGNCDMGSELIEICKLGLELVE